MPAEGLRTSKTSLPWFRGRDVLLRIIIVANGNIDPNDVPNMNGAANVDTPASRLLHSGDLLIAADGGTRYCQTFGVIPQVVIGDFDSLDQDIMITLQAHGVTFIRYPVEKDYTDLELAIQYAVSRGASEIVVLGALGNRWDQTLANLLLPVLAEFTGVNIMLIDGSQEIRLVRSGQTLDLLGQPGDTVSLIPLAEDVNGITTQGLKYPLLGEALRFGSTRGISNVLLEVKATIYVDEGMLLCVLIHQV